MEPFYKKHSLNVGSSFINRFQCAAWIKRENVNWGTEYVNSNDLKMKVNYRSVGGENKLFQRHK